MIREGGGYFDINFLARGNSDLAKLPRPPLTRRCLRCYSLIVAELLACSVISVLPSPAMKCFELLSLLVVVFEFGLFGAVNGNFRAERPNIDGEPNLDSSAATDK